MKTSDLKYLMAYIVPVSGIVSILSSSWWTFTTVFLVFGLIPLLELIILKSTSNEVQLNEEDRGYSRYFDLLLYVNIPLVYGALVLVLYRISQGVNTTLELTGIVLAASIVLATSGINVAHELGHKPGWVEQLSAKMLLLPCLYTHFTIEHNYGHHVNIATPLDPATSRKGEWLYAFWLRSSIGGYIGSWKIETNRLKRTGKKFFSLDNEMLKNTVIQLAYPAVIFAVFGLTTMLYALLIGMISFLFLETINYIEHYGLLRNKTKSGRYERVQPIHSWNSNHEVGRILLYELTRHSDHHFKANRKYQLLRHFDESPQLPLGYPGSILLSFVPPLWFALMNPRLEEYKKQTIAV